MSNRNIQIKLVVNDDKQARIKQNAKVYRKTVSAYIREVSLNMCVLAYDLSIVDDHTRELTLIRKAIYQLAYTIGRNQDYVPDDLEYILSKMKEI